MKGREGLFTAFMAGLCAGFVGGLAAVAIMIWFM